MQSYLFCQTPGRLLGQRLPRICQLLHAAYLQTEWPKCRPQDSVNEEQKWVNGAHTNVDSIRLGRAIKADEFFEPPSHRGNNENRQ